MTKIYSYC